MDKNKIYEKIFKTALQNEELLIDFLEALGFSYDSKTSSKNRKFFFSYAGQKTGSINIFQDKQSGNYLFYDFARDLSGNIFTLLELYGIKEGKLAYLVQNYPSLFNLSNEEIEQIMKQADKNMTFEERFLIKSLNEKLPFIKNKIKKYSKKETKRQTFLINCDFTKIKNISNFKLNNNFQKYPQLYDFLTKKRKLNPETEVIASMLLAREINVNGEIISEEYISGISIPYGIFNKKSLDVDSNTLRSTLLNSGFEFRGIKPVFELKSYSKVNYKKENLRKTPTFLHSGKKKQENLLIFESMFDYYAIAHLLKKDLNDIIILNGASMDGVLLELIKDKKIKKDYNQIIMFPQADKAGEELTLRILKNKTLFRFINYKDFYVFSYKKDEVKKDINDLVKEEKINSLDDIIDRLNFVKSNYCENQKNKEYKKKEIKDNTSQAVFIMKIKR